MGLHPFCIRRMRLASVSHPTYAVTHLTCAVCARYAPDVCEEINIWCIPYAWCFPYEKLPHLPWMSILKASLKGRTPKPQDLIFPRILEARGTIHYSVRTQQTAFMALLNRQRQTRGGGGGGRKECHNCRSTDHLQRDCPAPRRDGGGRGRGRRGGPYARNGNGNAAPAAQ